jgi:hypothetical protein
MPHTTGLMIPILMSLLVLCLPFGCATQVSENADPDVSDNADPDLNTDPDVNNDDNPGADLSLIEPDDYEDGTELTNISTRVTLTTALDDNSIAELFEITATEDTAGHAPTGTHVFAHHNIPFFNDYRRLRMDFANSATRIQIIFGGTSLSGTDVGHLEAYDSRDNLVAEYVTEPLGADETEVMEVNGAGIAWAVAYGEGSIFARLDELDFTAR